jgi:hypothetical protein
MRHVFRGNDRSFHHSTSEARQRRSTDVIARFATTFSAPVDDPF